jgi:hypothetical protein
MTATQNEVILALDDSLCDIQAVRERVKENFTGDPTAVELRTTLQTALSLLYQLRRNTTSDIGFKRKVKNTITNASVNAIASKELVTRARETRVRKGRFSPNFADP